jgi:type IV pilus assembly protein PilC
MSTATVFEYRARDRSGGMHQGTMEGPSPSVVASALRSKGYIPLEVRRQETSGLKKEISIPGFRKKVKPKEVAIFSRQLSTMINSGLTLIRSLAVLEQQTENPELVKVIAAVRSSVEEGTSLSGALEAHPAVFNPLYVSMVRSGELGGVLDGTLHRLADTLEAAVRLRSKVKSAMAYPTVVLSLIAIVLTVMLVFIVPIFAEMYADLGGSLPVPTLMLIAVSNTITTYWWIVMAVIAGSVVAFRRWKATEKGRFTWDAIKLRMPIVGTLVQKIAISRFARTLSALSRSGVPVLQALDIVADTAGNSQVRAGVVDMQASARSGESLTEPLERHAVFPAMVTQMMVVGEETGALDEMLTKVSDFYDQEVEDTVASLTSLIEPLLIIGMGVTVGGILVALYLPMFNIVNLIQ